MNPGGPLLRRSLQPTVQARSFCREHRQLFGWICKGLLSTGKHGSSWLIPHSGGSHCPSSTRIMKQAHSLTQSTKEVC